MQTFVVTKPLKSVGVGILLTLAFGPIGLFYSSVVGGLVMLFGPIILLIVMILGFAFDAPSVWASSIVLILLFAVTWWLICMIWAVIGVNNYNRHVTREVEQQNQNELYRELASRRPKGDYSPSSLVYRNEYTSASADRTKTSTADQSKPSLEVWLKSNPGKSINDYFSKYPINS